MKTIHTIIILLISVNFTYAQKNALIEMHIAETNAVVPMPNPKFDPALYKPELIGISAQNKLLHVNANRRGK